MAAATFCPGIFAVEAFPWLVQLFHPLKVLSWNCQFGIQFLLFRGGLLKFLAAHLFWGKVSSCGQLDCSWCSAHLWHSELCSGPFLWHQFLDVFYCWGKNLFVLIWAYSSSLWQRNQFWIHTLCGLRAFNCFPCIQFYGLQLLTCYSGNANPRLLSFSSWYFVSQQNRHFLGAISFGFVRLKDDDGTWSWEGQCRPRVMWSSSMGAAEL